MRNKERERPMKNCRCWMIHTAIGCIKNMLTFSMSYYKYDIYDFTFFISISFVGLSFITKEKNHFLQLIFCNFFFIARRFFLLEFMFTSFLLSTFFCWSSFQTKKKLKSFVYLWYSSERECGRRHICLMKW